MVRGSHSRLVTLPRGVRQGCLLSTVSSNVSIHDILKGEEHTGVPFGNRSTLPGLLFADDVVCVAPTRRQIETMNNHVTNVLAHCEMAVGINACWIIGGE